MSVNIFFGKPYANCLPDGRVVILSTKLDLRITQDVWCEPRHALQNPQLEQYISSFINSPVEAGFCPPSGEGRFNWVKGQIKDHFTGDAFDWIEMYVDGARILAHEELGFLQLETIDDAFGASPRRVMNHLKKRAHDPRQNPLHDNCLARMSWLTLAMKIWFARAGHPESREPFWP